MTKNNTVYSRDNLGNAIALHTEIITGKSARLPKKILSFTDILVPAYTKIEFEFARKMPREVQGDFMLGSLAPFLDKTPDQIDWDPIQSKITTILDQFFITCDWLKYTHDQDTNIFVVAEEQTTKKRIGIIQFLFSHEFKKGTIKAALFGVLPEVQNRGIEKLLLSSIFILYPEIQRIFLHTRCTNEQPLGQYQDWGFQEFTGNLPNWKDMEYIAERSDVLQKTAETFQLK